MVKKAGEKGALAPLVFLLLMTSLVGLAVGYKAVQSPTNIAPKAQQLRCSDLNQYPNRKCEEILPGPCSYGAWKYQCTGNRGPCAADAGVGIPYWCGGTVWHNMNFYGECTTSCKVEGGSPTPPSSGGTGGRCFYLTVELNQTQNGDFDAWVTFNTDDKAVDFHDIKLDRDGAHVAGYNKWSRSTPFTYWPEHTGGRILAGSSVTFTGRDDNCGDRGNTSTVVCTTKADGTVSGEGCFLRGKNTPTPTPTPTLIKSEDSHQPPVHPPQKLRTPDINNILNQNVKIVQQKIDNIVNPQKQKQPTDINKSIRGVVKINNNNETVVEKIFVALYRDQNDQDPIIGVVDTNGEYIFSGMEERNYIIKAWARDTNGQWYQNQSCTLLGDPYDCVVKASEVKNLEIDIGAQRLRNLLTEIQETSKNVVETAETFVNNVPIVGPLVKMFLISAF